MVKTVRSSNRGNKGLLKEYRDALKVIHQVQGAASKVELDLSDRNWITQPFIVPLACYLQTCDKEVNLKEPRNSDAREYVHTLRFPNGVSQVNRSVSDTYLPLVSVEDGGYEEISEAISDILGGYVLIDERTG